MTIPRAIQDRMNATGFSYEKVMAELEMMNAAKVRYETGNLTAEDRKQIAECRRHWQPQGRGR